jgi:hypothetical protein
VTPLGYVAIAYVTGLGLLWVYAIQIWIERGAWDRRTRATLQQSLDRPEGKEAP